MEYQQQPASPIVEEPTKTYATNNPFRGLAPSPPIVPTYTYQRARSSARPSAPRRQAALLPIREPTEVTHGVGDEFSQRFDASSNEPLSTSHHARQERFPPMDLEAVAPIARISCVQEYDSPYGPYLSQEIQRPSVEYHNIVENNALQTDPTQGSEDDDLETLSIDDPFADRASQISEFDEIRPLPAAGSEPALNTQAGPSSLAFDVSSLVSRRPAGPSIDRSSESISAGRKKILVTKWLIIFWLLSLNTLFIFFSWYFPKYYYIFLPFITITVALNCVMVFSIIAHIAFRKMVPEKECRPESPENMVYILPCYNESREECTKSLDSLVSQINIDAHKKAMIIVCDGRVRGAGMEKSCADHLLDDILSHRTYRERISAAYTGWERTLMDVEIQIGSYQGIPYMCIIKDQNQGKRDSLILIRSFLYNFNIRDQQPAVLLSAYLFGVMANFLVNYAGIENVDCLIGMDADTVFAENCIEELLKQSHYNDTIGVCGYVAVDFSKNHWDIWRLYQSSEYMISQCLRRLHQSLATHKVSCLPGCCQLLKICETTCGDHVLVDLFGYYPSPRDNMLKQIRATASEDRNHVCLMLSARPKARTRQALRAKAFTDVPHSWGVFLSQRRRWTLGATSNDLFLVSAGGVHWFERILATANVVTWVLNPFIIASIVSFIKACLIVKWWIIISFSAVMIIPMIYYLLIVVWCPRGGRERVQYLIGLFVYVFLGPFLNILVLSYALWNMDNFAWGKTRQVVKEVDDEKAVITAAPARNNRVVVDEEANIGTF